MTPEEIQQVLRKDKKYKEIWLNASNGHKVGALINEGKGILVYLPSDGIEAGAGDSKMGVDFHLSNGQGEVNYPDGWTYDIDTIEQALLYFLENEELPDHVKWTEGSPATSE